MSSNLKPLHIMYCYQISACISTVWRFEETHTNHTKSGKEYKQSSEFYEPTSELCIKLHPKNFIMSLIVLHLATCRGQTNHPNHIHRLFEMTITVWTQRTDQCWKKVCICGRRVNRWFTFDDKLQIFLWHFQLYNLFFCLNIFILCDGEVSAYRLKMYIYFLIINMPHKWHKTYYILLEKHIF